MQTSLVSTQNRVESPFIIAQIGDYTFGHVAKKSTSYSGNLQTKVTFPNFLQSLNVKKVNGAVNIYSIKMTYQITQDDDPNLLERVFSSSNRKLILKYGDWSAPEYIYKNEEALITKVSSNVDFNSSKIEYTITATSNSLALTSGVFNFAAKRAKPSDEIKRLLKNETYGLLSLFTGMRKYKSEGFSIFIAGDDQEVQLQAQKGVTLLSYINYLVSCMTCKKESLTADLKKSRYYWATYDDISNEYGGAYFKVTKVTANIKYTNSFDTYEVDIGYPSGNYVSSFTLDNNESWSILYNHASSINLPQYTYAISNDGSVESIKSPAITRSSKYLTTTAASKDWWSKMTQYPISAKLTIKGLLRPAMLMSHVKINTYFYGHKHISSGLYIITKQEDTIDSNGYKTTLSVTRISGDEMG